MTVILFYSNRKPYLELILRNSLKIWRVNGEISNSKNKIKA